MTAYACWGELGKTKTDCESVLSTEITFPRRCGEDKYGKGSEINDIFNFIKKIQRM